MKYAVIADIHANLEAFQVVLEDAKEQKCTHYCCVGDVVGYSANPKECLDIVREHGHALREGQPRRILLDRGGPGGLQPARGRGGELDAQTAERRRTAQWLRELKYVRLVASFSMVHATLDGPQRWGYVFDKLAAAASFTYQNTSVCFFGHTHVPVAFVRDSVVRGGTYSKFKVEPGRKYFVNVGSVGQPRDGNPKAAYVIYDLDEGSIELRRLDYDIPKAQKKILEAGLPPRLADRLAFGK